MGGRKKEDEICTGPSMTLVPVTEMGQKCGVSHFWFSIEQVNFNRTYSPVSLQGGLIIEAGLWSQGLIMQGVL